MSSRIHSLTVLFSCITTVSIVGLARAQTWDGGGLNGGSVNWTTATNWNPDGVPVNNGTANIVMAGAIDLSNTVDASYDIASLAFNSTAGPFTINGATLTIRGGGINNTSSANQMLALPIIVNSGQTWSNSSVLSVTGTTVMLAAPLITYGPGTTRFNTLIIGNSMLQFNGTGLVELLNGNTYTGSTSINNGTLAIGHASALSGSSSLNLFGGTLTALGGSRTITNNTTSAGSFSLGGTNSLVLSGSMTLTSSTVTISVDTPAGATISGSILQNASGRSLVKTGSQTLTFSGTTPNTYSGSTTVNGGTLMLSKTAGVNAIAGILKIGDGSGSDIVQLGANDQISDASTLLVDTGGVLNLNGFSETVGNLNLGGGLIMTGTGTLRLSEGIGVGGYASNTSVITGNLDLNGSRSITVNDAAPAIDLDIPAVISNGSLQFYFGTGTTRLSGANVFTGKVILAGTQTLLLGHDQALGIGGTFDIRDDVTVEAYSAPRNIANPLEMNGNLTIGGSNPIVFTGDTKLTGNRIVALADTANATFRGAISEYTPGCTLTIDPNLQSMTFDGTTANTYTGLTSVMSDGYLYLAKSPGVNAIGAGGLHISGGAHVELQASNQIADTSTVTLVGSSHLYLGSFDETISGLSFEHGGLVNGSGTLTLNGDVQFTSDSGGTAGLLGTKLNLGGATRTILVEDQPGPSTDLYISELISNGALTKEGAGTLRLSGADANTYVGMTRVNEGTLELSKLPDVLAIGGDLVIGGTNPATVLCLGSGQIPGTASIVVNSNSVLRLNGSQTIGPLTLDGGGVDLDIGGAPSLSNTVTVLSSSSTAFIGNGTADRQIDLGTGDRTFVVGDGSTTVDLDLMGRVFSSSGRIVKSGPGVMRLSGLNLDNSFDGLIVNQGTVLLDKPSGVDAASGNITIGDGVGGTDSDVLRLAHAYQIEHDASATLTINTSGLFDLGDSGEDIGNLVLNGGHISNGTLSLLGNSISTSAQAGSATIDASVNLLDHTTSFSVADGAADNDLVVNGFLYYGRFGKVGAGTIRLSGAVINTAALDAFDGGTILLDKPAGVDAIGGTGFTIGDANGGAQADVLRYGSADNQLPDTISVAVSASGLFDLNGRNETIRQLTLIGSGVVNTGIGTLTITESVNCSVAATTGTVAGHLSLGGSTVPFTTLDGSPSIDLIVNAALSDGVMRKVGTGTLLLSGAALMSDVSYVLDSGCLSANGLSISRGKSFTFNAGTFQGALTNQGTFNYNGGSFDGQLSNHQIANFNADFTANNGLTNSGTMTLAWGRNVTLDGTGFVNAINGVLTMSGGTLRGSGPLVNEGVMTGTGTIAGSGGFTNAFGGLVTVSGGTMLLTNTGANANAGVLSIGAQHLQLAANLGNTGLITLGGGSITGSGTLTNINGGEIRGGSSLSVSLVNDGGLIHATGSGVLSLSNLSGGNINGGELRMDDGATLNVAGAFSSTGTVVLNGANAMLTGGTFTNTGTLRGDGRVTNLLLNSGTARAEGGTLTFSALGNTNTAYGRIEAGAGSQILYSRGLATNAGDIALTGGSFDNNNAALVNTGAIEGYGTLRTGGLTNTGTISVGGTLDVLGAVTNNSTVNTQSGTLVRFFGPVNGSGDYPGSGTVQFLSTFNPGTSPAAIDIGGSMALASTATLTIEIGGFTPGVEHDQVNIGQTAFLGGRLDITSWNGFQILPGDEFSAMTYGSRSGDFASMTFTGNVFTGLGVTRQFNANSMLIVGTGLPGDTDLDGDVDFNDLLILAQNYGVSGRDWFTADFDRSTTVDFTDLLSLAQHYGQHLFGVEAPTVRSFEEDWALAGSVVPEPAMIGLTGLLLLSLVRRR